MRTSPAMLFGTIALNTGTLTRDQLSELIEEQSRESAPLGELCERRRLLTPNQIRSVLEVQRGGRFADEDTLLGSLAVRNGFATKDDLSLALEAQHRTPHGDERPPEKLGQILLAMGFLTHQKLKALLSAQGRLRNSEPAGDEDQDSDTREIAVAAGASRLEGPPAWLIQETAEGRGELFPLGLKALLGRLPSHDVPVPDMAASRHHARVEFDPARGRHVLVDLESRNGIFVNGERVAEPRTLEPGDRVQIGETVFRYAAGALPLPARSAEPPTPIPAPPPAPEPRLLDRAKAFIGRLAPSIHPQRKVFALAGYAGLLATFLPWSRTADASRFGFRDLGLATFALFAGIIVAAMWKDRAQPVTGRRLHVLLGASGLAAFLAVLRLAVHSADPATAAGLGVHLAVLAGLAAPLFVWIGGSGLEEPAKPWQNLKGTTIRIARKAGRLLTGSREAEKAELGKRRDAALRALGEAALLLKTDAPEAVAAGQSSHAVETLRKREESLKDDPNAANECVRLRSELAALEARLERSLQKLGRAVVDRNLPMDGEASRVAEVRDLDGQMKALG
jgi:hypothetical protein